MQIQPNKTVIEGVVRKITAEPDGFGRSLEISVDAAKPAHGEQDFLGAAKGDVITLFLSQPVKVEVGKRYSLATTVLGGPGGSRAVIESIG